MTRLFYIIAGALLATAPYMDSKSGTVGFALCAFLAGAWAFLSEGVSR